MSWYWSCQGRAASKAAFVNRPVGASLLAIAVCQPTSMSDVMASSRASSLPQDMDPASPFTVFFTCHPDNSGECGI
ncbi:hypothetical protein EPZ47_01125 [Pseudomonas viciae]|uniref:Uncharacterized protein n=1 Tax=Pseudomonas viciae TaxID=2505979 RepID=A0A4P7PAK3_9PSED|nr:hypothetical protein EPZ47_01125 [Pseudomonas viciae]